MGKLFWQAVGKIILAGGKIIQGGGKILNSFVGRNGHLPDWSSRDDPAQKCTQKCIHLKFPGG